MTKKKLTTSAMIASIAEEGQETIAAPFGYALSKLAETRPEIVGVTADLAKYTDLHIFAQNYPDRFFQVGIAEQLAMATAGGLAKTGLIPFVTTYAVFATRRAYEFIHQIIAEENLNVKIAVALPGLTTGYGPSHQATEDIAMMRAIPNMTVIDPCDATELEQIVPAIADHNGPVYLRLLRGKVPNVLKDYDYQFEIGKAKLLEDGNDVLMISTGILTMRAIEAAKKLASEGISVAILHCPTIKPLDNKTILKEITKSNRLVVTAENHSEIGGLGEAVSSLLVEQGISAKVKRIALPDKFLLAGALPTLHDEYGISTAAICNSIKKWLAE
ncbi:transketolase subunit B [Pasteurella testudinis DSM 23072]|uniref:Transketolase subunit B n=1 Tax=Pasteurella testudinis DSM 23072 TaxID=1122938 RepID=A0A1W1UD10_9PAST|nr:transketolase family protein [Pasteurella testudinis]SMB78902.1 transketolase subunit B [Pasteurella testudinis DSM 23072]SUB52466.1 1-deoxy-D-xylulose-5-phosphate synthase [Pasteurella testudinis]